MNIKFKDNIPPIIANDLLGSMQSKLQDATIKTIKENITRQINSLPAEILQEIAMEASGYFVVTLSKSMDKVSATIAFEGFSEKLSTKIAEHLA